MYRILGNAVSRYWPIVLVVWTLVLIGLVLAAPKWEDVVRGGEFAFLPKDDPSRVAEDLFKEAFPDDLLASSIVIVIRRETHPTDGLSEEDKQFIDEELKPRLVKIARENGGLASDNNETDEDDDEGTEGAAQGDPTESDQVKPIVAGIHTFSDLGIGSLLVSEDQKASLVIVGLTTEFLETQNWPLIEEIEKLIAKDGVLRKQQEVSPGETPKQPIMPAGLDLAISGSATVGRDMRRAAQESANATELWTVILVLTLLVVIYRAPILALIPLTTVAVSVTIALNVLALLSRTGFIELFSGIESYVTVLVYGAGVDYCLFQIARYKEELDAGATYDEAVANALAKVGATLTASAGTVMCGIGMMVFAEFGKFREAGKAISLSLFICLLASLTLTPALLRMWGRLAFWPKVRQERISATRGWISAASPVARLLEFEGFRVAWEKVGRMLVARPGTIWMASIAVLIPFAVIGVMYDDYLSYGLLSELPQDDPSVVGAEAVQVHFPAGATGEATLILVNKNIDFSKRTKGVAVIKELTDELNKLKSELHLADIRSASHPLGGEGGLSKMNLLKANVTFRRSIKRYTGGKGKLKNHVTRIDMVFEDDPFSRHSIEQLDRLENKVESLVGQLPAEHRTGWEFHYKGPTASIRDLKRTTDRDQRRIYVYVLASVFVILVLLLRRPAICAYLIVSVFFSYLVTLGMTFAVFWLLDPTGFAGLDWKVPMFLFTILIAVGEDYNIFLMTRIEEEQAQHGPIKGVTVALQKTGSIISSCGFIMAGTFSSLLAGSLVGMNQLGFALAFGVLLDTFVVRPILVPAYLILLYSGRFGRFGKILGAGEWPQAEASSSLEVGRDS